MQTVLKLAVVLGAVGLAMPAQAATLTNAAVDFNEYAFPAVPTVMSGTQGYNLFNDTTGAKLTADNGDGNDLSLAFTNSGTASLSNQNSLMLDGQSIVSTRQYLGKVSRDNPGTLISNTVTLKFAHQWDITDLKAKFTSINTAGTAWEYAVFSFLRPDGTPFSTAPTIGQYSDLISVTPSRSQGWYVAARKDVVQGVGTNHTSSGARPSGNFILTYALAGLDPNTPIGGLVWTTYLEDTRGTKNNTNTNAFIASWEDFTVSGVTHAAPPVPTPALLPGLVSLGLLVRRRRAA
jgi:hypothetical protein